MLLVCLYKWWGKKQKNQQLVITKEKIPSSLIFWHQYVLHHTLVKYHPSQMTLLLFGVDLTTLHYGKALDLRKLFLRVNQKFAFSHWF